MPAASANLDSMRCQRPSWEKQTARKVKLASRPVDCLGLTKRWSLYVASTATPGSRRDLPAGRNQSLLTESMRAVASNADVRSPA